VQRVQQVAMPRLRPGIDRRTRIAMTRSGDVRSVDATPTARWFHRRMPVP